MISLVSDWLLWADNDTLQRGRILKGNSFREDGNSLLDI